MTNKSKKKGKVDRYCSQCQEDYEYAKEVGAIKPWELDYPVCTHK